MGDKVLVVDDEKGIRDMLSEFLTGQGYEVILASSGEEALELADIEKPRLILLDLAMPGLGGILACKKLKTQKSTRFIPIVVVSAFEEGWEQAIEAGADEFIQKPIQLTELQVRVRSMLRVAHLTHELESAPDP
jgi:DNA-binding response OmpR family regulator